MIYQACDNPSIKHALFSATLANQVEEWCKLHLDNVVRVTVGARYFNMVYILLFYFTTNVYVIYILLSALFCSSVVVNFLRIFCFYLIPADK